ncbi:cytidine deaminase [Halioxenophilus sp. WMMB6]|uniref:cytidine deaminase n=1 Tax=Halioxenophilus sp. WMMB6 TaxID=3073815 RepID=UPI00295EA965|nr:cytidine deaminase [Halioxenophilus sp. WMMB6]
MDIDLLKQAARDTAAKSYSPYSRFPVAVAFYNDEGEMFTGVNVENASYGLAICAERNAICSAVTAGSRTINTLVVYTPTQEPTPPCGACRQFIREFSNSATIISICDSDLELQASIAELLPGSFTLK